MSFKLFIYYCGLGGGWAAFLTWAFVRILGFRETNNSLHTMLTGSLLGALVAATIGAIDAIQNSVGFQRVVRVFVCLIVGLAGGLLGTLIGVGLFKIASWLLVLGWMFVGTAIGAIAGMSHGSVDAALMWLTDLFLSLPPLPLLLLIIYLFREPLKQLVGPEFGTFILIVAVIGGFRWMQVARLVRAQFLSLREKEFVEAARALGMTSLRLVTRHILPNSMGPIIVAGTIDVAAAIIAESTLSFLGLGFPPDIPTWGRILFDAKDYLDIAPHWALFAGGAIFLAVLSINFIGDGLRDALDPRTSA